MTCSRFLLNVCFVIGNLSRWFVMTCWSAASLHLHLLNVSNWVYNLMQTHAIPYPFVGFVTCISRSRERNCPSYVLLGRKIICPYSYTHEDIREFVCNNSLEARIGKQNVHGNKVYSGMERQKCISEPENCPTYKSADSLIQVCNLVYDLLTPSLITQE